MKHKTKSAARKPTRGDDVAASGRPSAEPTDSSNAAVWMVNGRMVSKSLANADVKAKVRDAMEPHRKNRDSLIQYYRSQGVLTSGGKLTKSYGG